jgi:hypothetical protein
MPPDPRDPILAYPVIPEPEDEITPDRANTLRQALGLFTEGEMCAILRVSSHTLQAWRVSGNGPRYAKLGRGVYYRQADVEAWIDDHLRTYTPNGEASAA